MKNNGRLGLTTGRQIVYDRGNGLCEGGGGLKRRWIGFFCAAALLLSGCGLIPKEEPLQQAPVINTQVEETFEFAYVERGDVVKSARINCTYMPARSESYRFGAGGETLDEIYVQVGDSVKEGQLLAQLNVTAYEAALSDVERAKTRLQLQVAHLEEWRQVALSRAEDDEERDDINEDYDLRRQGLDDQLYLLSLRQEEYEYQLSRRQIRAGLDGTVTYVRSVNEGYVSSTYETIVTVADSATSTFQASTEYWDLLRPGDACTVTVGKVEYSATVASAADLGLPESEATSKGRKNVYWVLDEVTFELEDGDRGSVTLILEEADDVLKLPKGAVGKVNGQSAVYYLDENGIKRYKLVVTGVTNGPEVEIVEGVTEGEAVIVN